MKEFTPTIERTCSRCVLDNTIKGIKYNNSGECTFCEIHDDLELKYKPSPELNSKLAVLIEKIKIKGKQKKYDCIVGVSGGRDSTYTLYSVIKLGLRPLAVHFDNGWNSDSAVNNIERICKELKVDLYTTVANWEEFKDLQKSFLEASVPDAEVPTDWVIFSVLFDIANKKNIKYIIQGHSFRTEGTTPLCWTYMDGKYVKSVHSKFGKTKLRSFPIMTMSSYLYYTLFKRIKQVRLLYYLPYNESDILNMLTKEVGWRDYGGKHHESMYTGFFQSYILTRKFNIDKRKLHYSALIRSGQMKKDEALELLKLDPYTGGQETMNYCLKKLNYTESEFNKIMSYEVKSFKDYKSYYPIIKALRFPIKLATKFGLIPETVFKKYFQFDD